MVSPSTFADAVPVTPAVSIAPNAIVSSSFFISILPDFYEAFLNIRNMNELLTLSMNA
jgi:hypothetical protein